MAHLYSTLPPRSYTLSEYTTLLRALSTTNTSFTRDIPIEASLAVYPVPDPADVLTTSVHLNFPGPVRPVHVYANLSLTNHPSHQNGRPCAAHKIPNFKFGFWGPRHQIYILFPSLFREDRKKPHLTKEEKAAFYELVLRPAVGSLNEDNISDWPAQYQDEMFRARKQSGHMSYQTKLIGQWELARLPERLRQYANENDVDWAGDFCFMLTVRGTKHSTQHAITAASAEFAYEEFLETSQIARDEFRTGAWWIDVGVEVASQERACLQWSTTSHYHMVKAVLGIDDDNADRITKIGSSKYARDLVSHLTAVSGCRIEPGSRAQGPLSAAYFQMYTTDKALTYAPEKHHHGKAITIEMAMGGKHTCDFILGLYNVYRNSSNENSSNARVEVRVPTDQAKTALRYLTPDVVRESLLAFPRKVWWSFRLYRLMAISRVFKIQAEGSAALRVNPDALLLTIAGVWLINGLHSRPEDRPDMRNLMHAVLPVTDAEGADPNFLAPGWTPRLREGDDEEDDDEENDQAVTSRPYIPFGVIFLRRINSDVEPPRMRHGGHGLRNLAFSRLFHADLEHIKLRYNKPSVIPREVLARTRFVTNKTRHTTTYINLTGEPQPSLFNLSEQGHSLPPPEVDSGSDVEEEADERQAPAGDIDSEITQLWRQFLIDIANKTPNPRGATNGSYLKISTAERLAVTEELYMNDRLSDMWSACQYRISSQKQWETAFDYLFPPPGTQISERVQNYRQCTYFGKWQGISSLSDPATSTAIRNQLREKVFALNWIPHASQDKLWPTSVGMTGFVRLPHGSTGAAPRILVKKEPLWD
ncbi:hypothetical protein BD779DRAFT_1478302 [Infundibulicybe gibba]|nr:hypothetical protein BD779DRAFT_1478302 [Infundibulicybe gibba]